MSMNLFDLTGKNAVVIGGAGGVAAVKAAMDLNGLVGGDPRLPLFPLTADQKDALRGELKDFGLVS